MAIKHITSKRNAALLALEYLPEKGAIGLGSGTTIDIMAQLIKKTSNPVYCVSKKAKKTLKKKKN